MRTFMILLALCSVALCEDHYVVVDDSKPGKYILEVLPNGDVTLSRPIKVTRPGTTGGGPVTPPPPTGDPLTFEDAMKELTLQAMNRDGGSKTAGAGISAVYSMVADGLEKDTIKLADWSKACQQGVDKIVEATGEKAKWAPFRAELSKTMNQLYADKKLSNKEQIIAVLRRIAAGMNAATGFDGKFTQRLGDGDRSIEGRLLEGFDIGKLIELIKLILELMKTFSPG